MNFLRRFRRSARRAFDLAVEWSFVATVAALAFVLPSIAVGALCAIVVASFWVVFRLLVGWG